MNEQGGLGEGRIVPVGIATGPSPQFGMTVASADMKFGFCHSRNWVPMTGVPLVDTPPSLLSFAPC
jgi:hypothetical protein